ncbi:uncharacterized protein LOC135376777 isoform X1 [Ornithodoros turicata]|uniref:uncharacterized protein LOC135376777 isoform X1 n=1 Tax=Ornithodoros turicata TaxID=34597 RepID=UPI00313A3689
MHWRFLECEEMEAYESFEEARKMLPIATNTSDLNGELEYGRGKRRRVRRLLSDDDSPPPVTPPRRRQPTCNEGHAASERHTQRRKHLPELSDEEYSLPATPPPPLRKQKRDSYNARNVLNFHTSTSQPLSPVIRHTKDVQRSSSQSSLFHLGGSSREGRQSTNWKPASRMFGISAELPTSQSNLRELDCSNESGKPSSDGDESPGASEICAPGRTQNFSGKRSSALLKCTESRPPGSCTTSFAQPSTNTPEFEKKVLRSLHIMSLRLLEHSDQLDIMLSYLQEPKETDESNIITRPLVDVESFVKFDEELQHSHKKKEQLQRQMIKIGGTSSGDRARRILYKIIADEVAQQFNWTGAGGKMKFSSLECCNVMCSAISKATNEGTLAEAEKAIQTWLRHARERLSKKAAKQRTA